MIDPDRTRPWSNLYMIKGRDIVECEFMSVRVGQVRVRLWYHATKRKATNNGSMREVTRREPMYLAVPPEVLFKSKADARAGLEQARREQAEDRAKAFPAIEEEPAF